ATYMSGFNFFVFFKKGFLMVVQEPTEISEAEGENLTLNCSYIPQSNVTYVVLTWIRYSSHRNNTSTLLTFSQGNRNVTTTIKGRFKGFLDPLKSWSSLTISHLQLNDSGIYYCE
uniref:Ig-like domain-containing protein n=1 Tax=Latimeria chalumnae TaxID=7897 RepID=H2ZWQ8_LATCH